MLKIRLISALTILPFLLLLFTKGPAWGIILFLAVVAGISVHEMATMIIPSLDQHVSKEYANTKDSDLRKLIWISVVLGAGIVFGGTLMPANAVFGTLVLVLFVGMVCGEYPSPSIDQAAARSFGILISICYAALPWLVVWQLYQMGENAKFILLLMAVTWMGDTGGYFGGRFLGGRFFPNKKFAPIISPKKTWEGSLCGLFLSVIGAFLLNAIYQDVFSAEAITSNFLLFISGVLGGIFEQLGDLLESLFKRFAQVKDSGTLIPGHGGLLDRIDGILFAAPVIWSVIYYGQAFGL